MFRQNSRGIVKRILGEVQYLPDKQKKAADAALEQVVLIYDILGSGSMDYGTLTGL